MAFGHRADPDALLQAIQSDAAKDTVVGKLKIFFGYAAGVGKTYAMLKAAHDAQAKGIDVVAGYVEPHARPQTAALVEGLEVLPVQKLQYNNLELREFDLDAALKRKPQLILVDELAHTNVQGCRHVKRYQDVQELLKAGINVYTTMNVQHLESLNDKVAALTGVIVRERIPDHVFDNATQVELVDIEPQELIERLGEGKVYQEAKAQQALQHFFSVENLVALREIALRRCADRVNNISWNARLKSSGEYNINEAVLVGISPSPSNPKIIRNAARMAQAFHGPFIGLYVERPDAASMSEDNQKRLQENMQLARQLGAEIKIIYGEDVAFQIAEFAKLAGLPKIVVGRSAITRRHLFVSPTLVEKLTAYAPDLDIYIIPDKQTHYYQEKKPENTAEPAEETWFADLGKTFGLFVLTNLLGFLFSSWGFSEPNIITVYILGVLITAVVTSRLVYSLVAAVVSIFFFNYYIAMPRYTFIYGAGYPVTFLVMLSAAYITGSLSQRIRTNARQSSQATYRTTVLLDTNRILQKSKGWEEIIAITAKQLTKLVERDIVFYPAEEGELKEPLYFPSTTSVRDESLFSTNERAVAAWAFKNNKNAGATTKTLSTARCLYLAVRTQDKVYGVVGIVMGYKPLDSFAKDILLSILGECALALENNQSQQEKEEAAVLAKNEQLRANLLRSISHDLRTPLTSISGNASILLDNATVLTEQKKQHLYTDIYADSLWLINLVENLLAVTRLEAGTMSLKLSAELVDDVVAEAVAQFKRRSLQHKLVVKTSEELLLARMDARLIMQVIINIVDNALKYTPAGSQITISTYKKGGNVGISIADTGPGISNEDKEKIFERFYTGSGQGADSRRSIGLGLSLCKAIVAAHHGSIAVKDNEPVGSIFWMELPAEEVEIHE